MEILKKQSENKIDTDKLLYLLNHYSKSIATKDLDQCISESNKLIQDLFSLKNVIFFSLFNNKLEVHSYLNRNHIEKVSSLLNESLLKDLSQKKELLFNNEEGDIYFLASEINQELRAFFVFLGDLKNLDKKELEILKIHNQFVSNLIQKEKTINDLIEHSEKSTGIEENLNNTVSVVSHELRTPLANILGFSELMLNKELSERDRASYLKEIFNSGQRLSGIIDNFLDFAKIKNGNFVDTNNFSKMDIEDLCFKAWRYSVKPNDKVELAWLIDTNLEEVLCDEAAISRVMVNLFTNAIKYSGRAETKIICEIKRTAEDEITISVKDNGYGIDEEEINKVFNKFYRSKDADKNFIGGSGLGLWICKEIVEAHGGKIACRSIANQGTEFFFSLKTG